MSELIRRVTLAVAALFAMTMGAMSVATVATPAPSWACDAGQVWDPGSNSCQLPPPPPPAAPVPVTMCAGGIPFVPLSWCWPVGGTQ
jgi:hypothetical protein